MDTLKLQYIFDSNCLPYINIEPAPYTFGLCNVFQFKTMYFYRYDLQDPRL